MCMCVCGEGGEEIKGRRRGSVQEWVEAKDRKAELKEREEKKGEFLSLYPCLDFLAGPLKRAGKKKDTCAGTSERDLDYASVYPTECCMAAGDSLLVLKLLWPNYSLKRSLLKI